MMHFRQDSTNACGYTRYFGIAKFSREYLAPSPCRFRVRHERRKAIESAARTFKKEEKSFYKFHSLPFAFPFCPTAFPVFRLYSEIALLPTSASTRANPAYSLDLVPFRFSLSRPIPAEDIRPVIRERGI